MKLFVNHMFDNKPDRLLRSGPRFFRCRDVSKNVIKEWLKKKKKKKQPQRAGLSQTAPWGKFDGHKPVRVISYEIVEGKTKKTCVFFCLSRR